MDYAEFFDWAMKADVRPTMDAYMSYQAGKESAETKLEAMRMEIKRLHEIIQERNHEIGLG
jgi:hypothetical protein